MAETFHWPDESEIEALDLESGTTVRGIATPALESTADWAVPLPSSTAPVLVHAPHEGLPSLAPTPTDPSPLKPRRRSRTIAWQELATVASCAVQTRFRLIRAYVLSAKLPELPERVHHYALPVLAAVVLLESGWLITGKAAGRSTGLDRASAAATTSIPAAPPDTRRSATAPAPTVDDHVVSPVTLTGTTVPPLNTSADLAHAPIPRKMGTAVAEETPGQLAIVLPFQVQVYEGTRLIGIAEGNPLPLTPGTHQLRLINESVGFEITQPVTITSGRTAKVDIALPSKSWQLNASPWAEVSVDGTSVGETPL